MPRLLLLFLALSGGDCLQCYLGAKELPNEVVSRRAECGEGVYYCFKYAGTLPVSGGKWLTGMVYGCASSSDCAPQMSMIHPLAESCQNVTDALTGNEYSHCCCSTELCNGTSGGDALLLVLVTLTLIYLL